MPSVAILAVPESDQHSLEQALRSLGYPLVPYSEAEVAIIGSPILLRSVLSRDDDVGILTWRIAPPASPRCLGHLDHEDLDESLRWALRAAATRKRRARAEDFTSGYSKVMGKPHPTLLQRLIGCAVELARPEVSEALVFTEYATDALHVRVDPTWTARALATLVRCVGLDAETVVIRVTPHEHDEDYVNVRIVGYLPGGHARQMDQALKRALSPVGPQGAGDGLDRLLATPPCGALAQA